MQTNRLFLHLKLIAFITLGFLLFNRPTFAQTDFWYTGKVVHSRGSCKWLIRITNSNDASFRGKLIQPTGDFPEAFQKRGIQLRFKMHPLRQPVPEGCIANCVASVVNPVKE